MKSCPNCGNQCQEQAAFCVNCGYAFPKHQPIMEMQTGETVQTPHPAAAQPPDGVPVTSQTVPGGMPVYQETPQPAPAGTPVQELYTPPAAPVKKKKKKALIITLASVAAVALAVGLFFLIRGIIARANPDGEAFLEIQRSHFAERFDAEEQVERYGTQDNLSMDISIAAEIEGSGQEVQQVAKLLDGSAIVFKMDSVPGRFLFNVVLNLKGSNILEGILTVTEREIGLSVPALDERYFVLDLERLAEQAGVDFSQAGGLLGAVTERPSTEDLTALGKKMRSILTDNISSSSLTTEDAQGVRLEGLNRTVDGRLTTWKPTVEELTAMQNDFAAFLESDETLHRLLENSFGMLMSDGGDIRSQLKAEADSIRNNARNNAEEFVRNGFSWSILTDAGGKLNRIAIDADVQGGAVSFFYETLTEGSRTEEALLMTENGVRQFALLHNFTDEGNTRSGTYDLSTAGGSVLIRFETDRSKRSAFGGFYGWWEIDLGNLVPGIKPRVEVTKDSSYDSLMTISVDGIGSYTGGVFEGAKLMVRVKEGSTAKEPEGTRTDITDYTDAQMQELVSKMGNQLLYTLLTSPEIMDILGSFYF
ncbi:MAG: zinc ribbon domain-containing protein [Lachnospiraceae bacterium]|nr:zinc ribbon domain-containing protein [Lachnospiraceae bacterium]